MERNATTDDVIGILPGSTDEISLVNTHTDGPNALEENGGLAMLALAKQLSAIPQSERKRTHVFLFATGHMSIAVGDTQRFLGNHQDLVRRTASALTIEHLGATEWVDSEAGGYHATGRSDLLLFLTSQNPALVDCTRSAIQAQDLRRSVIIKAVMNEGMFGVGAVLNAVGVPTVAFLGIPPYLLGSPRNGHIDKLDSHLMYRQIITCSDILAGLDATPRLQLALGGTLLQGGGQVLPGVVGAGWDVARNALPFLGMLGA